MKKIRHISQNPFLILLVLLNFMFVSCNRDEIIANQAEQELKGETAGRIAPAQPRMSGEELFRSIIFVDGTLTPQIDALSTVSQVYNLTPAQITNYRNLQNDFIAYAKSQDVNFFISFKNAMYSQNPEVISQKIIDSKSMLLPWLGSKLAAEGLSVEALKQDLITKNVNSVEDLQIYSDTGAHDRRLCGAIAVVAVFGLILVAVAVVVLGLAYWSFAPGDSSPNGEDPNGILLNSVSIQIAESLL